VGFFEIVKRGKIEATDPEKTQRNGGTLHPKGSALNFGSAGEKRPMVQHHGGGMRLQGKEQRGQARDICISGGYGLILFQGLVKRCIDRGPEEVRGWAQGGGVLQGLRGREESHRKAARRKDPEESYTALVESFAPMREPIGEKAYWGGHNKRKGGEGTFSYRGRGCKALKKEECASTAF